MPLIESINCERHHDGRLPDLDRKMHTFSVEFKTHPTSHNAAAYASSLLARSFTVFPLGQDGQSHPDKPQLHRNRPTPKKTHVY